MLSLTTIAWNTFKENLRDKILYNLLLFAFLLIGGSVLLGRLTIAEQHKVITDMGLAVINLVGVAISVFVGVGLVSKEIERRTIYTIMARPITRVTFILGKYAGLAFTLLVNMSVMLIVFLGTLALNGAPIRVSLLQCSQLIFVELLVLTAIALLFSTFSSTTVSATLTTALYIVGHLSADLKGIADKYQGEVAKLFMNIIYYATPNLEVLNVKGQAAAGVEITWSYQLLASAYGLLYAAAILTAASTIFKRRDF